MTPPCSRCGFDIETASSVKSTQHMLEVEIRPGLPWVWVCGHCHAPGERIVRVVKNRSHVQAQ